jgi:hypothetical protein
MLYPPAPSPIVAPSPLGRVSRARAAFSILAWVYVGAIGIQVLLAGVAVSVGPSLIAYHRIFAAFFLVLAPTVLVAAWIGHVGRGQRRLVLGLTGLLALQGGWIYLAQLTGIALIGAVHPVNALAMAIVAWRLARESSAYLPLGSSAPAAAVAPTVAAEPTVARYLQPWWRSGEPIPGAPAVEAPRRIVAI